MLGKILPLIYKEVVLMNVKMTAMTAMVTSQVMLLGGNPLALPEDKTILLMSRFAAQLVATAQTAIGQPGQDTSFSPQAILFAAELAVNALGTFGIILPKPIHLQNVFFMVTPIIQSMQPLASQRTLYGFVLKAVEGEVWQVVEKQNSRLEAYVCQLAECVPAKSRGAAVRGARNPEPPTPCDPKMVEIIDAITKAVKRHGGSDRPFPDNVVQRIAGLIKDIAGLAVAAAASENLPHSREAALAKVLGLLTYYFKENPFSAKQAASNMALMSQVTTQAWTIVP